MEVLPDFLNFAGNSVRLGFNSIIFDSKFMVKTGRYSHRIIESQKAEGNVYDLLNDIDKW